jgi:hypothetical protein
MDNSYFSYNKFISSFNSVFQDDMQDLNRDLM